MLNAGFRVVGNAGSDFPANMRTESWPRIFPLLGPERALVKAAAGESAYDAWAEGIRRGAVLVSNGPLLEFAVNGESSGAVVSWDGSSKSLQGSATAIFHRPIEKVEIVVNGQVIASRGGDAKRTEISLPFETTVTESSWVAARATALHREGEPRSGLMRIRYMCVGRGGRSTSKPTGRRCASAGRKRSRTTKNPSLVFADEGQRQELLNLVEETRRILSGPQPPWAGSN